MVLINFPVDFVYFIVGSFCNFLDEMIFLCIFFKKRTLVTIKMPDVIKFLMCHYLRRLTNFPYLMNYGNKDTPLVVTKIKLNSLRHRLERLR